jgi:hypothetical protein
MRDYSMSVDAATELPMDKVLTFFDEDIGKQTKTVREWLQDQKVGDYWCSEY